MHTGGDDARRMLQYWVDAIILLDKVTGDSYDSEDEPIYESAQFLMKGCNQVIENWGLETQFVTMMIDYLSSGGFGNLFWMDKSIINQRFISKIEDVPVDDISSEVKSEYESAVKMIESRISKDMN